MSQPLEGSLFLFGFPSTSAELDCLPRTTAWRLGRASMFLGGGLVLAPVVGMVPPHAPWAVAVLAMGGLMSVRKWKERFTLLSFRGRCPRCGGMLSIRRGTPIRSLMAVPCSGCNHESRLTVELPSHPGRGEGPK